MKMAGPEVGFATSRSGAEHQQHVGFMLGHWKDDVPSAPTSPELHCPLPART